MNETFYRIFIVQYAHKTAKNHTEQRDLTGEIVHIADEIL